MSQALPKQLFYVRMLYFKFSSERFLFKINKVTFVEVRAITYVLTLCSQGRVCQEKYPNLTHMLLLLFWIHEAN